MRRVVDMAALDDEVVPDPNPFVSLLLKMEAREPGFVGRLLAAFQEAVGAASEDA